MAQQHYKQEHAIVDKMEAGLRWPMSESGGCCCPVCMEPAEWVAVGPCGHREVCADCTVRMRFLDRNWRCCICRAFCPTVVITKAGGGGITAPRPPQRSGAAFPAPPLAAGGAGQVGMYVSFHSGVATYFDDPGQYEKARQMCLRLSSSSVHHHPAPAARDEDELPRILVVLAVGFLYGVLTYLVCFWMFCC